MHMVSKEAVRKPRPLRKSERQVFTLLWKTLDKISPTFGYFGYFMKDGSHYVLRRTLRQMVRDSDFRAVIKKTNAAGRA